MIAAKEAAEDEEAMIRSIMLMEIMGLMDVFRLKYQLQLKQLLKLKKPT